MREVTATQKEIEGKISSEMWERQWRLSQKRDIYARLLEEVSELKLVIEMIEKYRKDDLTSSDNNVADLCIRAKEVGARLERSRAVAEIYVCSAAAKSLRSFDSEIPSTGKADSELLFHFRDDLLMSASAELGLEL